MDINDIQIKNRKCYYFTEGHSNLSKLPIANGIFVFVMIDMLYGGAFMSREKRIKQHLIAFLHHALLSAFLHTNHIPFSS